MSVRDEAISIFGGGKSDRFLVLEVNETLEEIHAKEKTEFHFTSV
jgi:hypothetical protein